MDGANPPKREQAAPPGDGLPWSCVFETPYSDDCVVDPPAVEDESSDEPPSSLAPPPEQPTRTPRPSSAKAARPKTRIRKRITVSFLIAPVDQTGAVKLRTNDPRRSYGSSDY